MDGDFARMRHKIWQTLSSIKTGVILLITVVILSAVGTVVLQRPVTDHDEMQRAYSPRVLSLLDKFGLTDVFHAWWFVALLTLVSLSILAASIERFPNAWRYFARPYKFPDKTFRRVLPTQRMIPIADEETGLMAAERALDGIGFRPQRVVDNARLSIFAERHRVSEMAVYLVHASLLLIFAGGITDALWGWRGFLMLTQGQQSAQVEMRDGTRKSLPFSIRCDGAGQENYQDGTPKKWWSRLSVLQDGRGVEHKEIVVNDPLVYRGIRFYQSSYGPTGKLDKLALIASPRVNPVETRKITLALHQTAELDADTSVQLAEFIPDYVVRDNQVYTRTNHVENPAVHLVVTARTSRRKLDFWLPAIEGFAENEISPYQFEVDDLELGYFTGLEVSHEPGQWAVWSGVVLMGIGLGCVFYVAHTRFWAVPVRDARARLNLWVGGTANRNRGAFEDRFRVLTANIEAEVKSRAEASAPAHAASLA